MIPAVARSRSALAVVTLAAYGLLVRRFDFVCDDAFISFRYARNLARGLGLRYNPGVEPPVEGYSNFLWVLWMAVVEAVSLDPAVVSRLTSVACGIALLAWVAAFVRRVLPDDPGSLAGASLFLATLPPIVVWSTGGLATVPFALVVFGCFERLLGDPDRPRPVQAGLLGAAACLLRVDGIYWAFLIVGLGALDAMGRPGRDRRRAVVTVAALVAAAFVAHVGFRYAYHGDWISNTARVKVGLSSHVLWRGTLYVASFLAGVTSVAVVLAASPLALAGRRRRLARVALLMVAGTLLYGVLVGGDFMTSGRLLVPGMPFVAILLALELHRLGVETRRGRLAGVLGVAVVVLSLLPSFNLHPVPRPVREALDFRWNLGRYVTEYERWRAMRGNAYRWSLLGRALREHADPGSSLVFDGIGAVGYYSELYIFDQFGLVDRDAADRTPRTDRSAGHDRFVEPEYFLDRRPTYLGAEILRDDAADRVFEAPAAGYRNVTIPLSPADGFPDGTVLFLVARSDAETGG